MTEFTEQYAIRMPNGGLYSQTRASTMVYAMFGLGNGEEDDDTEVTPPKPIPYVYDDRKDAERVLKMLQESAQRMGYSEYLGTIVTRYCSPFVDTNDRDAAAEMISELQQWRIEEGEQ